MGQQRCAFHGPVSGFRVNLGLRLASLLLKVDRKLKGSDRGARKGPEVMDRKSHPSILRGGDERARNPQKGPAASLLS